MLLLVATTLIAGAGCREAPATEAPATEVPATGGTAAAPTTPAASPGLTYPPLYRALKLPELPGGTVTSTGRQSTSLSDGLSLMLDATESVDEARAFYRKALADAGWTENAGRPLPAGMPLAAVEATKDSVTYRAMIARLNDKTQVTITVVGQ
jgi:hypothetical protein